MPAVAPVAVNTCEIVVPLPADAPLAPDCVTVHAKVAPAGVDVNGIFVDVPEQIAAVAGTPLTTGVGFTVTTTS